MTLTGNTGMYSIEPNKINLNAQGVITAFVSLPSAYQIPPLANSVSLNGVFAVNLNLTEPSHLIFKFSRTELSKVAPKGEGVPLILTGYTGTYYIKGITNVFVN